MTSGRALRRVAPLAAVGLVSVLAYAAIGGGSGDPDPGAASPRRLVVSLPYIGQLTWRCDDAERFSTTLQIRGATVFATAAGQNGHPHGRSRPAVA